MDTKGRLIAGSHNRNEFILINDDEVERVTSIKELSGHFCQICGDEIEVIVDGEAFVAYNECAFPVYRNCYEYERREGTQSCPQYEYLTGIKGLSEAKVDKICEAVKKIVNFGYITGSDALIKRKSVILITTGRQALDELLGGGLEEDLRIHWLLVPP